MQDALQLGWWWCRAEAAVFLKFVLAMIMFNEVDIDSLQSWSDLWFAPWRDSESSLDWKGKMTQVFMISMHDKNNSYAAMG